MLQKNDVLYLYKPMPAFIFLGVIISATTLKSLIECFIGNNECGLGLIALLVYLVLGGAVLCAIGLPVHLKCLGDPQ